MAESKADSFNAYLEAKERSLRMRQAAPAAGGTALSILAALAAAGGQPLPLTALQAESGMTFASFAEAIQRLRDSAYITVTGAPGSESAALTKLGSDVAALARPA